MSLGVVFGGAMTELGFGNQLALAPEELLVALQVSLSNLRSRNIDLSTQNVAF
ncbi:MAG: hypothetical protein H7Z11_14965 [Verrucomicrobia bacterium]|nr:hypothetical protein [Leptolyngbya sp. ES-bin-22]